MVVYVVFLTNHPLCFQFRQFRFLALCAQENIYPLFPCTSVLIRGRLCPLPLSNVLISLRSNDRLAYGEAVIIVRAHRRDKNGCLSCLLNQSPSLFLVQIVQISASLRARMSIFLFPCPSVLIRGRLCLLAAEQCWRSGMVVYVVFLTNCPLVWIVQISASLRARMSIFLFPCPSELIRGRSIP